MNVRDRVRVRMGRGADEFFNRRYRGATGMIVRREVRDHGASAKNPAFIVRFDEPIDGEDRDMFWPEELETLA